MQVDSLERVAAPKASAPHRRKVRVSFVLAGLAILAAVAYLVFANTRTTAEFYMTIPQLRSCTTCGSQAVRVAGFVQQGSIVRNEQTQAMRFVVTDSGQSMPVVYSGVVPDIFKPGVQVVVEGHLQQGTFHAQTLLAKCPSKFQSATPAAASNGAVGN